MGCRTACRIPLFAALLLRVTSDGILHCAGERWSQLLGVLTAWHGQRLDFAGQAASTVTPLLDLIDECPEGVVSAVLAAYSAEALQQERRTALRAAASGSAAEAAGAASTTELQRSLLGALVSRVLPRFSPAVVLRRMNLGGWPDFGIGARVLLRRALRQRFPGVAELVADTEPRFAPGTAPAPAVLLPTWPEASQQAATSPSAGVPVGKVDRDMEALLYRSRVLQGTGLALVDCGAFDGSSLLASAMASHSLLAFEPMPQNFKIIISRFITDGFEDALRLWDGRTEQCVAFRGDEMEDTSCKCSERSGCATLVKKALGSGDLRVPVQSAGGQTSMTMHSFGGAEASPGALYDVDMTTGAPIIENWFKEVLGRHCVDIHLLKLDLQGSEFAALRGLESLLAAHRVRYIFLNLWPAMLLTWAVDVLGVLRFLAHYGFLCQFIDSQRVLPQSFEEFAAQHTTDSVMTDYEFSKPSSDDLLCEDVHWSDPCTDATT